MQLAANLSWLYPDLAWPDRFASAARDGFKAVEILMPYDSPADWYAQQLRAHDLELVLFNTPVADGPGQRGWAAVAGAENEFRRAFDQARAVASATGCRRIHLMAGNVAGLDAAACQATLRRNLELALALAAQDGLTLLLEALNRTDMPGYCYYLPSQVIEVLRHFQSPRLRMQFDYYHCVMEGLDARREVQQAAPWIGHVQIAGVPGRYEPDLAKDGLLDAVAALPALGYDGWIGCEYRPRTQAAAGLHWCAPLRARGLLA
jgi:hydroxypyruvate isomerase